MVKRIINCLQKDYVNGSKDNIAVYIFIFPILLSLILKFFIPSVQELTPSIAVTDSVGHEIIEKLEKYADVEVFKNSQKLIDRIEKSDEIAGITMENNKYVIVLEGNETPDAHQIAGAVLDMIQKDEPIGKYEHKSLQKDSILLEISASLLILTAVLVGGIVIGFNIVNEKEEKTIKALAVSPLRTVEFLASHVIFATITSIILSVVSSLILTGLTINYFQVIIAVISSVSAGLLLGFIIGGVADNLISAIAVMKVLFLLFVGIPIVSLFVPHKLQWLFYIFPHYWGFQAYQSIFKHGNHWIDFEISSILSFLIGGILIALIIPMLKKRLKLR